MKVHKSSLFWGILLVGFGAFALAQSMGYEVSQEPIFWAFVFGGISLLSLVFYLVDGFKAWGWLFPVGIFAALAFLLAMVSNDVDNAAMVAPLFFGIALPFIVAYFIDRVRNWWALIPAGGMLFLMFVMLMAENAPGEWIGALFLFMIALSFFVVYLNNRTRNWWALIPAGVMFFLSLIVVLSTSVRGEWIGALFLFAVGLSFLVVYLNNRARQWALLVAYIMFLLSLTPIIPSLGGNADEYFGSLLMFAVGFPFFIVYFRSEKNWWAIIPAGALTTISFVATFGLLTRNIDIELDGISMAFFMGGLAATFAVLWLRHAKLWARDVTIILAVLTVFAVFFGADPGIYWPTAFILGGVYLLYTALRPKTA